MAAPQQTFIMMPTYQGIAVVGAQGGGSSRYGTIYTGGSLSFGKFSFSLMRGALSQGASGPNDFQVLAGDVPGAGWHQGFFQGVRVKDKSGAFRFYKASDAFFSNGGSGPSWEWGNGTNPVWDGGSVGSSFDIELFCAGW